MNEFLLTRTHLRRGLVWFIGLAAGLPLLWRATTWFNQTYANGVGWILITMSLLIGSLAIYLYQRRQQRFAACATNPRLSPLQISGLAAEVLGAQLVLYAASPEFKEVLPFLAWRGWPYIFIIGGLVIWGGHSLNCNCHDEVLGRDD